MKHGIVYHARLESHTSTNEGYIGITSQRLKTRISQHKTNVFIRTPTIVLIILISQITITWIEK